MNDSLLEWLLLEVVRSGLPLRNVMTAADKQVATVPGWCGVMNVPHFALAPITTLVAIMVCSNWLN